MLAGFCELPERRGHGSSGISKGIDFGRLLLIPKGTVKVEINQRTGENCRKLTNIPKGHPGLMTIQ
jgi:hypothetical protein